jgi:peroxisomal membrane protein 4
LTAALAALQGGEKSVHAFAAAFAGGYYVFGANNAINMQINLYLLSRITVGLIRLAAQKGVLPTSQTQETVFPWFGALVWGVVLWLFEHHRGVLQASLGTSMQYLYKDSGAWRGAKDFLIGALP